MHKSQGYNRAKTPVFKNIEGYQYLESPLCLSLVTAPNKVISILTLLINANWFLVLWEMESYTRYSFASGLFCSILYCETEPCVVFNHLFTVV